VSELNETESYIRAETRVQKKARVSWYRQNKIIAAYKHAISIPRDRSMYSKLSHHIVGDLFQIERVFRRISLDQTLNKRRYFGSTIVCIFGVMQSVSVSFEFENVA
jgi:hypothetical protein